MSAELQIVDLGLRPYAPVLALQEQLAARRRAGEISDTLLLVEHTPVYTLGRGAAAAHILLGEAELAARGIEVARIGRGGDVTFHGPGQLVAYPILHLGERARKVSWYVHGLEEVLIRTLARYGVEAGRDARHPGVWVGMRKIAALGVQISRGVTLHGFALNVTTDLRYYAGIVPCGITDRGVASLCEWAAGVTLDSVKPAVVEEFCAVFDYAPRPSGSDQ